MKLEELKKKLYKPEAEFEERLKRPEPFRPAKPREKVLIEEWSEPVKKKMTSQQRKKLLIGLITFGVIFLGLIGWFIWQGLTSFDKDKVQLTIEGPERTVSGEEVKYLVKYQNNTRLALQNVQMVFHYPAKSIPLEQDDLVETIDLADLAIGQNNQIELPVRLIGLKSEEKQAWVELSYQPEGFSSRYTNQTEFSTKIISVPLILDFDLPERLVNGQTFNFSLKYLNQAEVSFEDLRLEIEYPYGFNFQSAEPIPLIEERIWSLGNLMAGEQGKIFIRGSIEGEEGQAKLFKAQLGLWQEDKFIPYTETVNAVQISLSPLSVSQTVNNSTDYIAQAGDELTYQITYKNTTNLGFKDVVITSKLAGQAVDLESLKLGDGSFDGISQTITWRASNLPALEYLAPYQEGQISFSVKLKDPLPINNYTDKNFIVSNTVKIDSSERPLSLVGTQISGQSELVTKIVSQLTLQTQAYYYDDTIFNSGPIPPKVGQATSYTIKWRLINTSDDLKQVQVSAYLPPHVQWRNKVSPSNANLKYNSQTGKLIWLVNDLPAFTGILLPVKQVAFQVAITPGLAHLGNLVELIGQSQVKGYDEFVGLELTSKDSAIDTDLPDDLKVSRQEGIVVE